MENRVLNFIKDNNLINKQPIVCATSGGVDSVCLIHILHKLGYKVILAHVNHHKRAQSEIEEREMQNLTIKMDIPFEVLEYHYDGVDNFHNDSHHARYNFFRDVCNKYKTNTIATAHHADDQMETVLIKIMEGSNLYGYGGISICNDDGSYRIIRPLLCCSKNELYSYAKKNNLIYFEDSSNFEDDFLRNRLRHHVIPLLKNECSDLANKIEEYSIQAHEAFSFIRGLSIDYLKKSDNKIIYETFSSLNIALKKDIISLMLENLNIRKNNNIILDILALFNDNKGSKRIQLENGYLFIRSYNIGYISVDSSLSNECVYVNLDEKIQFMGKYVFYFTKKIDGINAKYIKLCYNQLELPFCIRTKNDGDFIQINGGTKKVSRVLIDQKIPMDCRKKIPIITDNKGNILWIYNVMRSNLVFDQLDTGDIYFVCEEKI